MDIMSIGCEMSTIRLTKSIQFLMKCYMLIAKECNKQYILRQQLKLLKFHETCITIFNVYRNWFCEVLYIIDTG